MTQEPQEPNIIENRPLSMDNYSKKIGLTEVLEGISSLPIQLALMSFPDSGSCRDLCWLSFWARHGLETGPRTSQVLCTRILPCTVENRWFLPPSLVARCISFFPDLLSFVKMFGLGLQASSEQHSHPPCWFRFSGESKKRTTCINSEHKARQKNQWGGEITNPWYKICP